MTFVFSIYVSNQNKVSKYLDSLLKNYTTILNNGSDWFKIWYLIRFDQSAGSSQGVKVSLQDVIINII